jgi:hypothetical protein
VPPLLQTWPGSLQIRVATGAFRVDGSDRSVRDEGRKKGVDRGSAAALVAVLPLASRQARLGFCIGVVDLALLQRNSRISAAVAQGVNGTQQPRPHGARVGKDRAAALDADPTAVYRHYRDKDELVRGVFDRLLVEVSHGVDGDQPWRDQLHQPCARVGKHLRYVPEEVVAWVESRKQIAS